MKRTEHVVQFGKVFFFFLAIFNIGDFIYNLGNF